MNEKKARRTFVHQQDQTDCGVACLASIIRYYGGQARLERLRELSGTSRRGTSLLGLFEAAQKLNLKAGAYEADLENLRSLGKPCILHVVKDERLQHYVVCYGYAGGSFLIGDPATGISTYSPEQIEAIWPSRALLVPEPATGFVEERAVRQDQWMWLRRLIEADLNVLGLALALGVVIALLSLSTAVFSQRLIDDILPAEDRVRLVAGVALLILLLLARNGLGYIRQRFLIRQSRDFNNRVIGHFYGSLLRLPQPFFYNRKVGDLIARMNDTGRLQRAVTYVLGNVMIDVLVLIAAAGFILSYSIPLGLLALVSLPIYLALAYHFHTPIFKGQQAVMAAHAANESNYIDTMQGMSVIKAANKESFFSDLTNAVYQFFQEKIYELGRTGIRFNLWAEITGTLIMTGVLAWSAWMVLQGSLQLGELVAVLQMTGLLVPAAMSLALTNLQLQEARVAFDRMHAFTSIEPECAAEEAGKPRLETFAQLTVENLSFRFPGQRPLLEDISFTVRRGEMIALLGESGCGKTTTLHLLQRFYQLASGAIILNNSLSWQEISTVDWRRITGVVPQQIKIFNGTLLDNICLGNAFQEAASVLAFCRDLGFEAYFSRFPQGYATLIGEEGVHISGGQQQLVAFARALYRQPQVLLLDEATAAMDREMETFIMNLLKRLKPQLAVVMVTHRVQSAWHADRVYIVEQGRIRISGTPENLAKKDNLFTRSIADVRLLTASIRAGS